jgi:pectinesterase
MLHFRFLAQTDGAGKLGKRLPSVPGGSDHCGMRVQALARIIVAPLAVAGIVVTSMSSSTAAPLTIDRPGGAPSTPLRPQLSPQQAAEFRPADYLGDWRPSPIPPVRALRADYTADPRGAYPSVQSAIDAVVAAGGSRRRYVAVRPGVHREVVCVPVGAPPITLYGTARTAAGTVIVFDHANPTPKPAGTSANPCNPNLASLTYGTGGSATFAAFAADFQATNLTFANDYVEGTYVSGNQSAVALSAAGDRQVYENIRVLGNQDSLLANTTSTAVRARQYVQDSLVEGDTDFIFGRGTAVFERVDVRYVSSRRSDGVILAPSTAAANPYGFLFVHSRFSVDDPAVLGTVRLGRAWDESVGTLTNYVNGVSPNGQAVIRQSLLAGHVRSLDPWGPSTVSRPFCVIECTYSANRFAEYRNVGPGSATD